MFTSQGTLTWTKLTDMSLDRKETQTLHPSIYRSALKQNKVFHIKIWDKVWKTKTDRYQGVVITEVLLHTMRIQSSTDMERTWTISQHLPHLTVTVFTALFVILGYRNTSELQKASCWPNLSEYGSQMKQNGHKLTEAADLVSVRHDIITRKHQVTVCWFYYLSIKINICSYIQIFTPKWTPCLLKPLFLIAWQERKQLGHRQETAE